MRSATKESTVDDNFNYREISVASDATDDVHAESIAGESEADELADYAALVDATR